MQLFIYSQKPSPQQREVIAQILIHADPPIKVAALFKNRPFHQVSSWRKLVCWSLHRHHGLAQKQLALWFQLHTVTVFRFVKETEAIVAGSDPKDDATREVIAKIISATPGTVKS